MGSDQNPLLRGDLHVIVTGPRLPRCGRSASRISDVGADGPETWTPSADEWDQRWQIDA